MKLTVIGLDKEEFVSKKGKLWAKCLLKVPEGGTFTSFLDPVSVCDFAPGTELMATLSLSIFNNNLGIRVDSLEIKK